jgi:DNA-binding transcriptional LysR family regulator
MGLCQKAGFTPKVTEGVEQFTTLLLMVAAGYGVSLIPALPKINGNRELACARLIEMYATVGCCVAWKANESSPLVAGFLDVVRACCREEQQRLASGGSK